MLCNDSQREVVRFDSWIQNVSWYNRAGNNAFKYDFLKLVLAIAKELPPFTGIWALTAHYRCRKNVQIDNDCCLWIQIFLAVQ